MGAADPLVVDATTSYALRVASGEIVAGPYVRLAAARHLSDLEKGPARGLVWRPEKAAHAIQFIECLRHYQGATAGKLFILSDWQRFLVGSLFGWYTVEEQRRFRIAYVEIAKGNGKTPLGAAIALYALVADGEAGAEVYSAATSKDQAQICFNDAKEFVRSCRPLLNRLSLGLANIGYLQTSSYFRPVSAEGRGLDGKRPHVVIVDELHEHPNATVVEKMRAGTKGRTRALILEITNSGYDETTVCFEHHDYSIKVLQGVIENDSWFAFIAALDKGEDPFKDPTCWPKANPNLGVSVTRQYLEEQVREGKDLPSKRNLVLRLNFCRWTEASESWVDLDHWDQCAEPVQTSALKHRACYGGLDLASVSDFTAFSLVFPPVEPGERWKLLLKLYLPEAAVKKLREKGRLPIDQWIADELVTVTPGNVTDYGFVKRDIKALREEYDVKEIAYDRFNSSQLVTDLQDDGALMVGFGQGYASMSGPIKELERLYMGHQFAHGGHKVLRWMATNVVATKDAAENIKFDRARSTEKIDGMQSTAMALGRAIAPHEEEEGESFWEAEN
ncbi:phage terminase small subunit P27 family [Variovorax boronicumulans]|uniref:Phage terminase small subunit P27 family n=1 Tax=Variovorax boronicumulans TaxID=436515 RepID=A0A250DJY3_9BURK|nr:phage terminase small subunit P27 family [Variovorax boronicumulans]